MYTGRRLFSFALCTKRKLSLASILLCACKNRGIKMWYQNQAMMVSSHGIGVFYVYIAYLQQCLSCGLRRDAR